MSVVAAPADADEYISYRGVPIEEDDFEEIKDEKVFCPTGPGGGVDPHCGGGGSSASSIDALLAGKKVTIKGNELPGLLDAAAGRKEGIDLTKVHVTGTEFFDRSKYTLARSEMPVLSKVHKQQFADELLAKGVQIENSRINPKELKPVQKELSANSSGGMLAKMRKGELLDEKERLIVSSDGYIIDGHHRWAAAVGLHYEKPDTTIAVMRVGLPVDQLLQEAWAFNKREGIAARVMHQKEEAAKAFCPTGPGGGVDPTCGSGGPKKLRSGEELHPATRGKDGVWRDSKGDPFPDHVQKLKFPPTFKKDGTPNPKAPIDVHLNPKADGDCLALFKNTKGKDVRIYSANHTMTAAAGKFGRVSELRKMRKQIFSEIDADIKAGESVEEASVLRLIMQTGMRPGGDADTGADHKSYGATTLEGRHVVQSEGKTVLRFVPGKKHGQEIEMPIHDKALERDLIKRSKKAGPDGRLFDTEAGKVRGYSKTKDGGGFKTKDHRTALGTEIAIAAIKRQAAPKSLKEYKKTTRAIATEVSNILGNTPLVAIKDYIDPNVWVGWKAKVGA